MRDSFVRRLPHQLAALLAFSVAVAAPMQARAAMPDLKPQSAAVGPIPIAPGEQLTVTTTVSNLGDATAQNVQVRACSTTTWCASRTVPSIAPGAQALVLIPLTSGPAQAAANPHFFVVAVDPQGAIPESSETNNTLQVSKPGFVVNVAQVTPVLEEEHHEVIQLSNGLAVSYQRTGYGSQGGPSEVLQIDDPAKGQPHPVTGQVEPTSPRPGQPRIDPLVAQADAEATSSQKLVYVVKFSHNVRMPRLPRLPDTGARFSQANIPVLEQRMSAFEGVRRARISAASTLAQQVTQNGGRVLEYFALAGAMLVEAPKGMLAQLAQSSQVQHVEAVQRGEVPPGTVRDGRDLIGTEPYFNGGATGDGYIALLDTGVWTGHTLLNSPGRISFREDCVNGDGNCNDTGAAAYDPNDDCWNHGTKTAAILTGNTNLGDSYRGIASSWVDSWKVYGGGCGGLNTTAVHRGYDQAVLWGDQIVVAEMQSQTGSTGTIADDADEAFDAGTITIAANGNYGASGAGSVASPACAHKAIGVGNYNVDTLAAIASQSLGPADDNRYKPDIQAPTLTVTASTTSSTSVGSFSGTSGATPYAAGAASVLADWLNLTSTTSASGGKIYAALINGGPLDWGNFNNTAGTGKFALPLNGTLHYGSRNVSNHENEYVDFNVPAGSTEISVALWWGENANQTHRDIDLYLRKPDGSTSASSISSPSVFERIKVSSPASGMRDIRIYGYSVPAFTNVTVYYAIHVK